MKDFFKFKPGTEDIGYITTAITCLTGIAIGVVAAIKFYRTGADVTSMATLAAVFVGSGISGHVFNNFSQRQTSITTVKDDHEISEDNPQ